LAYECWQASQARGERRNRKRDTSKGNRDPSGNKRETSGNRRDASGNRRETSGNRRDASGNRREVRGNRREASGNRRDASGNRSEIKDKRDANANGTKICDTSSEPSSQQPDLIDGLPAPSSSCLVRTEAIVERTAEDKTTSPSSGYNSCCSGPEEETFLIDLSSPAESRPQVL
jgi:hypothetical protein